MHAIYNFVSGPLVWVAFIVFTLGSLYRLIDMFMLVNKKEKFILSYMSWRYGLRSILHWIIPFGSEGWRSHPAMTIVTFAFHICLIIIPVFLLSHIILWDEAWNVSWPSLPDSVADAMTLVVIASCIFFLIRRLTSPEVKFVTSVSDYVILAIVAAPFITGFLAYHQWVEYQLIAILHILSGEIMLMAIPFTRLSHMLFSPLTRAYMGSEFGGIKNAKDW
ncbi:MAG: nitrate reductase [Deltaproteobacteria bacterium]|nr:nitrate reductase [Deltaproteobacteria bacterium]